MRWDLFPGMLVQALGHNVIGAHRYIRAAGIVDSLLTPQF